MKTSYQYIFFDRLPTTTKTSRWICKSISNHAPLAVIAWYAPWRQYCFEAKAGAIFNAGCLADIQDFIKQLMAERKPTPGGAS